MGVNRERAALMAAVDNGVLDVADVVALGRSSPAAAGIRLRRLLECRPGMTPRAVRRVLSQTRSLHGGSGDPTIAYLTDPRAAGRRIAAFAAAYDPRPGTWPGFPFTPAPASWRRA